MVTFISFHVHKIFFYLTLFRSLISTRHHHHSGKRKKVLNEHTRALPPPSCFSAQNISAPSWEHGGITIWENCRSKSFMNAAATTSLWLLPESSSSQPKHHYHQRDDPKKQFHKVQNYSSILIHANTHTLTPKESYNLLSKKKYACTHLSSGLSMWDFISG